MASEKIKETKEKIIEWLKEESCSPQEQNDPNAYFNIVLNLASFGCRVLQPVQKSSSIIAAVGIPVPPDQLALIRKLDAIKKHQLVWDVRLSFLENGNLDFNIDGDGTDLIKGFSVISRPIFYEELTKPKLFEALYIVTRATLRVIYLVQKATGTEATAQKETKVPYST